MKHKRSKHGGKRIGSGRPHKWQGGQTKLVRIPISYVEQILRVVDYMDANEGRLPPGIAFHTEEENFTMPDYNPSRELPYPDFDRYHKRNRNSTWNR